MFGVDKKINKKAIGFSSLYDGVYFFSGWCYSSDEVDFEYRMCVDTRGVLVRWHNVELIAVSSSMQS